MKRIRTLLLSSLGAAVIVLCGFLPFTVGLIWEASVIDQTKTADISPITLQIEELSFLEKIAIISNGSNFVDNELLYSIADTRLDPDEISETVMQALRPYIESGLIAYEIDISTCELKAFPLLVYDMENPAVNLVLWKVDLVHNSFGITVFLDDDTGEPLLLAYEHFDTEDAEYSEDATWGQLQVLTEIYFGNLGLSTADAIDVGNERLWMRDGSVSFSYHWVVPMYGEFIIELEAGPSGFSVYFV